ncbi:MAG: DUF1848 domain-containing protein [Ruminococcus sp.]|jgi:hypothetical protein
MIISASRRTDIPAFYSEWMIKRLKEEYVLVRNPMNFRQISRVSLSPDVVDGIVFWTKNPLPLMNYLSELEKYSYYFQFTLTSYGTDMETNLPSKEKILIPAFQRLSESIGRERIVWRYDPIFFTEHYTMEYHLTQFEKMASQLGEYTEKCTISFLDFYRKISGRIKALKIHIPNKKEKIEIVLQFAKIAERYGFIVDACAEEGDYRLYGVNPGSCIDRERLERIIGCGLNVKKDPNQRQDCGCIASIDIGAYNTCDNGCVYCYANHSRFSIQKNRKLHRPDSPLLFGQIHPGDIIKEREMQCLKLLK